MIGEERFVILIGGAPTTGKSTLAKKLAQHFDVPWISTDQIRKVLQATVSRERYPDLFNAEMSVEEFLQKFPKEKIVEMENAQSKAIWDALSVFINDPYPWKSLIVEGVAILPEFVQNLKTDKKVLPLFLVDEDADRMRQVIYTRGLFAGAREYSDSVKEKEVEWCLEFVKQLKVESTKYGFETTEVSKNDSDFDTIVGRL